MEPRLYLPFCPPASTRRRQHISPRCTSRLPDPFLPLTDVVVSAWIFELAGGAIGDYEDTCLPKEQREATWTVAALHQWDMGIDDPRCVTTAESVSPPAVLY